MDYTKPSIDRRTSSHMWRALTRIYWSAGHGGFAFLGQQSVDRLAPDGVIPPHLTTAENLLEREERDKMIGAYHLIAAVVLATRLILRAVLSVLVRLLLDTPASAVPDPVGTVAIAVCHER